MVPGWRLANGAATMDRKRAIRVAIDICAAIVRTIHLRHELGIACAAPELNFWRLIYGTLTDAAFLEWCKVFGADDSDTQPVHWKSIVNDQDGFRNDLLTALSVSKQEWNDYWIEMKTYRDHAVAHFDPRQVEITRYPPFDLALKSSYFFYSYLRSELSKLGDGLLPENLEDYCRRFAKKCNEAATVALGSTKHIRETVY